MEKINFINGQSPYISAQNLNNMQNNVELKKYDFQETLTETPQGFQYITLPAYYKKGAGVLQVYFEGCLLDKGTHYEESADSIETVDGDILNTIKIIFDCSGTYNMSIVIQGEYEAPVEGTESEVV